jgi:zinc transporter
MTEQVVQARGVPVEEKAIEPVHGLIYGYLLDGQGGGRRLDWDGVRAWRPEDGYLWVHLDRTAPETVDWLRGEAEVDPLICQALLAEETRPRAVVINDGVLMILRGVNQTPGAEPDELVSLRFWIGPSRMITLRHMPMLGVRDVRVELQCARGPKNAAELLIEIIGRIVDRIDHVVGALDDTVDALEDEVLAGRSRDIRARLAETRRQAARLRRFITPQRDALAHLVNERVSWIDVRRRAQLREIADRVTRLVEELDAASVQAIVTQDELAGRTAEQLNRNTYIFSVVAAIMLPLNVIASFFGMNVGGIPAQEHPWGFWLVVGGFVVLGLGMLILFRKLKWI